jgi:predicted RNA-binding protein with PIN domain
VIPVGARFLLIDGYNLLHAAGLARTDYLPDELRRQREKLLRLVARQLSAAEVPRVTVIFDARDPTVDRPNTSRFAGMAVIFARPEGDADLVIARWLDRHPAPRHVTLVSGDRALQRAARGVGARWLDSHSFLMELADRAQRRSSPEPEKPEGTLSPAEAAEWSRWFGPVELADLAAEPLPVPLAPLAPPVPIPGASPAVGPASSPPSENHSTAPSTRHHKPAPRGPSPTRRPAETNAAPRPDVQTHKGGARSRGAVVPDRDLSGPSDLDHWLREFASLQEWVSRQESESSWMRDWEGWWTDQRWQGPRPD